MAYTLKTIPPRMRKTVEELAKKFPNLNGTMEPFVRAWWAGGHVSNVPVGRVMQPGRKFFVEEIMMVAARMGAEAVALISESWMLVPKDKLDLRIAERQEIGEHPLREEVLHVCYEIEGLSLFAMAKINRERFHRPRLSQWEVLSMTPEDIRRMTEEDVRQFDLAEPLPMPRFQNIYEKAKNAGEDAAWVKRWTSAWSDLVSTAHSDATSNPT